MSGLCVHGVTQPLVIVIGQAGLPNGSWNVFIEGSVNSTKRDSLFKLGNCNITYMYITLTMSKMSVNFVLKWSSTLCSLIVLDVVLRYGM